MTHHFSPRFTSASNLSPSTKKHSSNSLSCGDPSLEYMFNPVRGEMALWKAVITQALMDAASNSQKPEAKFEKIQAREWLLHGGKNFNTVCENAGLDPSYVREKARMALARDCKWRAESRHKTPKKYLPKLTEKIDRALLPVALISAPIASGIYAKAFW